MNKMIPFEEAQAALTEIADAIPEEIFRGLNGGIVLLPEEKLHPEHVSGDLFILGEYHYDPRGFGRYISLYYGSFCRVVGHRSQQEQIEQMKKTLYHELTHHLESLAGDKSLEIKDAEDMLKYRRRRGGSTGKTE